MLTEPEIAYLAEVFARWSHPAVRDPARAAVLGGGDADAAGKVFELLQWVVSEAPVPDGLGADYQRLGERLLGAIAGVLRTSPVDRQRVEEHTEQLVLMLEPFCMKVLAMLEPVRYATLRGAKKGLNTVICELERCGRIPYMTKLTDAEFRSTEGWDARTSYENAVRDVLPARLDKAHRASAPGQAVWMSAMAFLAGIIDSNRVDILTLYGAAGIPLRILPSRQHAPRGIPAHHRIISSAPEPMTTRSAQAAMWHNTIEASAAKRGRVLVLEGPPGWGKSMFLACALDGIDRPMHFVDLTDTATEHDIAAALLTGLRLAEEDSRTVDQRPLSSVRLLSEWMGTSGIIVFENLHRSVHAKPPAALARYIRSLHEYGHLIVLETWTRKLECVSQLSQGQVEICTHTDLPRLSRDEVAKWGANMLRRQLEPGEISALELFDGYPLAVRRALETLNLLFHEPGDGVEGELLEMCLHWEQFYETVATFISHRPESGVPAQTLNEELATWFAVLPWAQPTMADLGMASQAAARRLIGVGFITIREHRCHVEAWARIFGLRQIFLAPEPLLSHQTWLEQLAATVPATDLERQRRHIACVSASLPSARTLLMATLRRMPALTTSDYVTLDDDLATYESPLDIATVEGALAIGKHVSASVAPSAPTASMPADVQFWLIESAGRRNDVNIVEQHLQSLASGEASPALHQLRSSWKAVKALHRALAQLDINPRRKLCFYETICSLLADNAETTSLAYHAWMARFLAAAARCAMAAGSAQIATTFLKRAEAVHHLNPCPQTDPLAKALYDDTAYRIAAEQTGAAANVHELLTANRLALEAIPPASEWFPERVSMWALRETRHLRLQVRFGQPDPALERRLITLLRRLPLDCHWWHAVDQLLSHHGDKETFAHDLREMGSDRIAAIDDTSQSERALLRLGRLTVEEGRWLNAAPLWALEAADRLVEARPDDLALLSKCIAVLARDAFASTGPREIVAQVAEKVVAALRPLLLQLADDEAVKLLYAQCLGVLARKYLPIQGRPTEELSPVKALARMRTTMRRIDGLYNAHIVDGASPWLWDDWARWKVACTRRIYAVERSMPAPDLEGTGLTRMLDAFVHRCNGALGQHPAADAVSVRIARYLWNLDGVRKRVQVLAEASANFSDRSRIVEIVTEALSAAAFAPRLLRANNEVLSAHEVALLSRMLAESMAFWNSESVREWGMIAAEALERDTDAEFWESVVRKGRTIFGNAEDYWQQIMARLELVNDLAEPVARRGVDQLTDLQVLGMAGRLFRFGAGNDHLPVMLRHNLGELAVAAEVDADAWYRSSAGRRNIMATWNIGVSIGLALAVTPTHTLFGTTESPQVNRHGSRLTWTEWMDKELSAAHSGAPGRFRTHSREVWSRLRELTGEQPLQPKMP